MTAISEGAEGLCGAARRRADWRYLGVLAVWLGLLLIRPRLALEIFRERRADSPIPRLRRRQGKPDLGF